MPRPIPIHLRVDSVTKTWSETRDSLYTYPANAVMTQEESEEYARINADIHTYAEENITKFVTGEQDMSEFDAFVENLKSMNLNQVTAIKAGGAGSLLRRIITGKWALRRNARQCPSFMTENSSFCILRILAPS